MLVVVVILPPNICSNNIKTNATKITRTTAIKIATAEEINSYCNNITATVITATSITPTAITATSTSAITVTSITATAITATLGIAEL